ncbi:I78 family peptidase inhibitor [Streptomyces sp. NPDC004111]|uniref:I78 family peptidase inhibitor n=1 Tax=Streptomyces sp. NPDC004111 TaxID=3364690 RepID=UPI0036B4E985
MHSSHLKTLVTAAALAATFFAPAGESRAAEPHAAEPHSPVAAVPDHSQWVGRTLVRAGDRPPAGVPAARLVHERDLPKPYRIITPGSFVTQEYNPDRLNVHVDDSGTITRVDFG